MQTGKQIKTRILAIISGASKQRIRPIDLERTLVKEGESSKTAIKRALAELVQERKVVYSYRDPCSFVEIPAVQSNSSI